MCAIGAIIIFWKLIKCRANFTNTRSSLSVALGKSEIQREKKKDKEYNYVNVTAAGGNTVYTREQPPLLLASASHGLIFKLALGPVFALAIVHASVDY